MYLSKSLNRIYTMCVCVVSSTSRVPSFFLNIAIENVTDARNREHLIAVVAFHYGSVITVTREIVKSLYVFLFVFPVPLFPVPSALSPLFTLHRSINLVAYFSTPTQPEGFRKYFARAVAALPLWRETPKDNGDNHLKKNFVSRSSTFLSHWKS